MSADDRVEAGRAEAGPGGVGVEKGRRRHHLAGALDLDPADAGTGLPAQRSDRDLGPTHLGMQIRAFSRGLPDSGDRGLGGGW
jgi:hypothetical protein